MGGARQWLFPAVKENNGGTDPLEIIEGCVCVCGGGGGVTQCLPSALISIRTESLTYVGETSRNVSVLPYRSQNQSAQLDDIIQYLSPAGISTRTES